MVVDSVGSSDAIAPDEGTVFYTSSSRRLLDQRCVRVRFLVEILSSQKLESKKKLPGYFGWRAALGDYPRAGWSSA